MDMDVVTRFLEKTQENSVLIRTDGSKARCARGQTSVVAKGGDESAAPSETTGDTAAEFCNRTNIIQVGECVAHADHKLGALSW